MKALLMLLLLIPTVVQAKTCKRCPDRCEVVSHRPKPTNEPNCFQKGFEVVAGFRWDRKAVCPTLEEPKPEPEYPDPIFLGLQQRLPLNAAWVLQARVDRDLFDDSGEFIATPHWNAAVSLHWSPWK